ncbi:hypothetical protein CPB97_001068 [Podila verticillata]|nr:hypothetical protein CPB97_001068 [Podila verticillata]
MTLLHEDTTLQQTSNITATSVSTLSNSDTVAISTAPKEAIKAVDASSSNTAPVGTKRRHSLYIDLDDKPLPALPNFRDDNILSLSDIGADDDIVVSIDYQNRLEDTLILQTSEHKICDGKSTSRDLPAPILISNAEPGDSPLSDNIEKTDSPSITESAKRALAQWLPLSPSRQPSNTDDVELPEFLPLPVTTATPPSRTAFDSVRGSKWIESQSLDSPNSPFTIPAKAPRAFDQASIATSASITSLRAAAERITEYVAVSAHTTVEYLTTTTIPSTVDFATRSANTTAQYLSSQLQIPRIFSGSVANQGGSSDPRRDSLHPNLEDPTQRERRIRREQRHLSRAYTSIHLGTMEPNYNARSHTNNQRSQSAPMLIEPRNNSSLPNRSTHIQPPSAAFLGSRRSHTNTIASTSSTASSISGITDRYSSASTIASTRSIVPKRKRARRPLQTVPGPEGLDPEVRRELEAQDFAALRLRDETEDRAWRTWWDPRRYGLPRYVLFDELRRPKMCTVVVLVVVVTSVALPIGLKSRE